MLSPENIHNGSLERMNNIIMNRTAFIEHQKLRIELPLFFPSISSVKTNFRPIDYLKFIEASNCPNFLISAFDIFNQNEPDQSIMIGILNKMKKEGRLILLDSGNYESYWHRDNSWSLDEYNEILENDFCSFCFSFDYQNIEEINKDELTEIVTENAIASQAVTQGTIAPIVHAKWEDLEYVSCKVVQNLNPKFIAIPERLLGSGIITRVKKLRQIRVSLNELGYYTPIHLLGTGNPFSILLFTYAGADTFDGLEWCQTCIDEKTLQVYHFQLRELFDDGNGAKTLKNYEILTLLKNIQVYQSINKLIQTGTNTNDMIDIMKTYFSERVIQKLQL